MVFFASTPRANDTRLEEPSLGEGAAAGSVGRFGPWVVRFGSVVRLGSGVATGSRVGDCGGVSAK